MTSRLILSLGIRTRKDIIMFKNITAGIVLATAVAGGLTAIAAPASAATAGAGNAVWVEPGATRSFLVMCPSYAPTMLTDTIKINAATGVSVSTSLDTDSDAFSRDMLTVTAMNGGALRRYVSVTATCSS
jgi:anti-sigma factor RsiW